MERDLMIEGAIEVEEEEVGPEMEMAANKIRGNPTAMRHHATSSDAKDPKKPLLGFLRRKKSGMERDFSFGTARSKFERDAPKGESGDDGKKATSRELSFKSVRSKFEKGSEAVSAVREKVERKWERASGRLEGKKRSSGARDREIQSEARSTSFSSSVESGTVHHLARKFSKNSGFEKEQRRPVESFTGASSVRTHSLGSEKLVGVLEKLGQNEESLTEDEEATEKKDVNENVGTVVEGMPGADPTAAIEIVEESEEFRMFGTGPAQDLSQSAPNEMMISVAARAGPTDDPVTFAKSIEDAERDVLSKLIPSEMNGAAVGLRDGPVFEFHSNPINPETMTPSFEGSQEKNLDSSHGTQAIPTPVSLVSHVREYSPTLTPSRLVPSNSTEAREGLSDDFGFSASSRLCHTGLSQVGEERTDELSISDTRSGLIPTGPTGVREEHNDEIGVLGTSDGTSERGQVEFRMDPSIQADEDRLEGSIGVTDGAQVVVAIESETGQNPQESPSMISPSEDTDGRCEGKTDHCSLGTTGTGAGTERELMDENLDIFVRKVEATRGRESETPDTAPFLPPVEALEYSSGVSPPEAHEAEEVAVRETLKEERGRVSENGDAGLSSPSEDRLFSTVGESEDLQTEVVGSGHPTQSATAIVVDTMIGETNASEKHSCEDASSSEPTVQRVHEILPVAPVVTLTGTLGADRIRNRVSPASLATSIMEDISEKSETQEDGSSFASAETSAVSSAGCSPPAYSPKMIPVEPAAIPRFSPVLAACAVLLGLFIFIHLRYGSRPGVLAEEMEL